MKRFTFSLLFSLSILMVVGSNDYTRLYGDVNGDKRTNITDVTDLINYLLTGEMAGPEAIHSPNMTIAEFKAKHWQDARNYVDTVTENEVIHGWVTSSDQSGNIYKTLYITDESGAGLTISVNRNGLYNDYPIGQEIVLPMQGYYVGKYNGQQQLGFPQWYAAANAWETTFIPQNLWESLVELNDWPDPERAEVQPVEVTIDEFQGMTDSETLLKYQSRLVCIKGVRFTDADGTTTYAESMNSTNRIVVDESGNRLVVRNSNYADFAAIQLPLGTVDLVGLLMTSGTTWQLCLRGINDVTFGLSGNEVVQNRADLETMGAATSVYGTHTSAQGWVAENSALLSGSDVDTNPYFKFIGFKNGSSNDYAMAPTLNGKTTAVGTLVSPVLHGGTNRLCFNYGAAFTDNVLSFRVDVKQDGEVVKTWTVTNEDVTKQEVYPFDETCSIDGDFTIEFTNLCPSNATSNKNRVSLWNITWDSNE